jgi:hypothetical protein
MSWDFMNEEFSRERHIFIPNTYTVEDIFAHIEHTMKSETMKSEYAREYTDGWIGKPMGKQIGIINLEFGDQEQQMEVYIYEGVDSKNSLVVDGEAIHEDYFEWSDASTDTFESVVNCLKELER